MKKYAFGIGYGMLLVAFNGLYVVGHLCLNNGLCRE